MKTELFEAIYDLNIDKVNEIISQDSKLLESTITLDNGKEQSVPGALNSLKTRAQEESNYAYYELQEDERHLLPNKFEQIDDFIASFNKLN